jgi:hypothetical protein
MGIMWTNISLSRLLKPGRLSGFIYFYKIQTGCMQKWFILLVAGALLFSCKNNNQQHKKTGDKEKGEKMGDTIVATNDHDTIPATAYIWKEVEQKKFLADCRKNMEGKVDSAEVKIFCSCMLTQSQKYYPGYKQMEENSNDESDRKISLDCLEKYPTDKDDQ